MNPRHLAVAAALASLGAPALAQQANPHPGYVTGSNGAPVITSTGECWRAGSWTQNTGPCAAVTSTSAGGSSGAQLAQASSQSRAAPLASRTTTSPAGTTAETGAMEPGYINNSQGVNWRTAYGECWRAGHWTPALAAEPCDATARASVPPPVVAAAQPEPTPAPQAAPEPAPLVQAEPRGPMIQKITLETDVLFGFDKAELRDEGKRKLDEIADGLKGAEVNEIVAVGHTDRIGNEQYNEKLSQRRSEAVKQYLVQKGVSGERIVVEGRGEQSPVTGSDCSKLKGQKLIQCFEPDRRVEIEVFGQREVADTGQQPAAGATSGQSSSSSSSGSAR
jgi:OOP family OmpA-OmpF porin